MADQTLQDRRDAPQEDAGTLQAGGDTPQESRDTPNGRRDHETIVDGPAAGEPAPQEPATAEPHQEGPAAADSATAEPRVGEPATGHPAAHESMSGQSAPDEIVDDPVAGSLWTDEAICGFQERWRDLQLRFVDDPRATAHQAKDLLSEALEAFSAAVASRTQELDTPQTTRGDDTERMRTALRQYRNLLDRLLSA